MSAVFLAATLVCATVGCGGTPAASVFPGATYVPVARAHHPEDYFISIDADMAPDGTTHLLWTAGDYGGHGPRLWRTTRRSTASQWSTEQQVDSAEVLYAKCAVTDSGVHTFHLGSSAQLKHRASRGGGAWQDLGVISREGEHVLSFDLLATAAGILVAYLAYDERDDAIAFSDVPTRLVVAELQGNAKLQYTDLITLPHVDRNSAGPVLMETPTGPRLVCIVCYAAGALSDAHVPYGWFRTRLLDVRARSRQKGWFAPVVVLLDPASPDSNLAGHVRDATAASGPDGTFVLLAYNGIMGIHATDSGMWDAPERIGGYEVLESSMREPTMAAAADSAGLLLAWCDTREASGATLPGLDTDKWEPTLTLLQAAPGKGCLRNLATTKPARVSAPGYGTRSVAILPSRGAAELYWTENQPQVPRRTPGPEQARIGSLRVVR
jgi:hypothetical protein